MKDAADTAAGLDAVAGDAALLGLATLGKTAAALALIVILILLCAYLLRRAGPGRHLAGSRLRVVASQAVGPRERVVIVDAEDARLVLGVGGGQINRLHQLPVPDQTGTSAGRAPDSFSARIARSLQQHSGPPRSRS